MSTEALQGTRRPELPSAELIFGSSPEMRRIRHRVEEALQDDLPVLIEGESGTGKEILGHYLHKHSSRRQGPFVKVNCGAVPARLLEREMFGFEEDLSECGRETVNGSIGMASRGTLFLDELGEMDLTLQLRVAQMLKTGRYRNEDGGADLRANARFMCSSRLELQANDAGGLVIGELLGCFPHRVRLVPLRERKADIPQICEYLAQKFARNFGRPVPRLSQSVLDAFKQWNWPGNIRELENWIARIVIFGTEEAIGLEFRQRMGVLIDVAPKGHRATSTNLKRGNRIRGHG